MAQVLSYRLIRLPDREYTFQTDLLHVDAERIVMRAPVTPSKPLVIGGQEMIGDGYHAVWFLFNGKPWDVGRFYRPDGTFTGYYADVLETVSWEGEDPGTLRPLVDLFLDLWVGEDGAITILDEDEFEEGIRSGWLTPQQATHARAVLERLVSEARTGDFPPSTARDFPPLICPDSQNLSQGLPLRCSCSTVGREKGGHGE